MFLSPRNLERMLHRRTATSTMWYINVLLTKMLYTCMRQSCEVFLSPLLHTAWIVDVILAWNLRLISIQCYSLQITFFYAVLYRLWMNCRQHKQSRGRRREGVILVALRKVLSHISIDIYKNRIRKINLSRCYTLENFMTRWVRPWCLVSTMWVKDDA